MIVSIASGKGGTGKTTVATNLAFSLESESVFLDCDVEEPNAHLFLDPVFEKKKTAVVPTVAIDERKCTFCGKCAEICRFKAIAVLRETVLTFPELCHGCGGCSAVCPEQAVYETDREVGKIETGESGNIRFVHGRMRIGEAMSPPLIRQVKRYVDSEKINIIDAPPGTSCPVITAIRETDFVLLVTEPTPFGLHDVRLAIEAVNILEIPCGLVINKADMGDDGVKNYAKERNIPILLEIPFERRIAEIYSRGELVASVLPEWREKFVRLYDALLNIVERSGKRCGN